MRVAVAAEAERRYKTAPARGAGREWCEYRETLATSKHRRRAFVMKFDPDYWGDPWKVADPWDPFHADCWISDGPDGGNSWADFKLVMPGDLIFVMRGQMNSGDLSPFDGRKTLMGVWHIVARRVAMFASGPRRPSTELWHLPLVRFDDKDAVDVRSLRSLDPSGVGKIRPFTKRNDSLVACADAGEEALLAAACSLPADVLTTNDLIGMAGKLAGQRCGMRDLHRKYWRDLQYKHQMRSLVEATAIRVVQVRLASDGWVTDPGMQWVPNWGGDLDCWRTGPSGRGIQKLCVEVKGTHFPAWQSHVKLQRSQRERAERAAQHCPLPEECDYDWELHVQAGIALNHDPRDDASLPPVDVCSASWVHTNWLPQWVN